MKWQASPLSKLRDQPRQEARACNCIGPQNGNPVCPCMMPAYLERQAGKRALDLMGELYRTGKPRIRVKAGGRAI